VVRTTGEARRAAGLVVALALRVPDGRGGGGGESGEKHAAAYYYYFYNTRVLPLWYEYYYRHRIIIFIIVNYYYYFYNYDTRHPSGNGGGEEISVPTSRTSARRSRHADAKRKTRPTLTRIKNAIVFFTRATAAAKERFETTT